MNMKHFALLGVVAAVVSACGTPAEKMMPDAMKSKPEQKPVVKTEEMKPAPQVEMKMEQKAAAEMKKHEMVETKAPEAEKMETKRNVKVHTAYFVCENKMKLQAKYVMGKRNGLVLRSNSWVMTLPQAVSGSGVRYAGIGINKGKAEWHEKSGTAIFSYTSKNGKKLETNCQEAVQK